MKCPTCGSEEFYIKDDDDEYDIYEFTCSGGEVVFSEETDAEEATQVGDDAETFCNRCAWHGKFGTLE